jgi:hypothetical protein
MVSNFACLWSLVGAARGTINTLLFDMINTVKGPNRGCGPSVDLLLLCWVA